MINDSVIELCVKSWVRSGNRLSSNSVILDLYNKKILPHIFNHLQKEFTKKETINEIMGRVLPINILRKTINKLAKAYNDVPYRDVSTKIDSDIELVNNLVWAMQLDDNMTTADKYLNMFDEYLLNPFYREKDGKMGLRVIPSDRFVVVSTDPQTPTEPDTYVIGYGKNNDNEDCLIIYDDDSFTIVNIDGKIQKDIMFQQFQQPAIGENIYGRAPFVYVNKIDSEIQPPSDDSSISISTLIPILFGDLNYGIKYQSFSTIWGKNVDLKGWALSPSASLELKKKNPMDETEPEIGQIKPDLDIEPILNVIKEELGIWLSTKGLRPTTVSTAAENFSSGISKLIDESDTFEERQENQKIHKKAEGMLFDLVLDMQRKLASNPYYFDKTIPTEDLYIDTIFRPIEPFISRRELIDEQDLEVKSWLTSRRRAIQKLNPHFSDEQIDELIKEIELDNIPSSLREVENVSTVA